nr:putative ribonuclease H-like domain-containing protein [Tanacetum cinerariifolium]
VLVDLPHGKRAIGNTQEEGIDYEEAFAPVARIEAIRLFLAYASFMGFMVYQMDVKSAFLYGTIKEDVYVCQPLRFEDPDYLDKVYKVVKVLYGLHQAPRAWYATLTNYLLENGFQRGKIDETLFIKWKKGDILLVQIYVDDFIFGSTNKDLCKAFEKLIQDKFQMSSIGELTLFLGLQVKQKQDGIFISQDKYVAKILRKFSLIDGKSASTPIDTEKPLLKDPNGEDVDVHTYIAMIGSLMVGKGCFGVETPLFEGMLVAQQVDESVAELNDDDVPTAGVADEGVAEVNVDVVPAAGRIIADMDAYVDVTLKDIAKDIAVDAEIKESADVQERQAESQAQVYQINLEHVEKVLSMQDDEVEPAELQE